MDLLEKMATFVRVIEAGSFSAAAKQLAISPAAVSRQIATLETEVKASLITRSTRRMSVTPAGTRYYERCLRVLREVDEAQAIGRGGELDGPLNVNAPVTFGVACVVPQMHSFLKKYPTVRIDLRLEDRLVDLVSEGIDIAIRVGSPPPESTEVIAHPLVSYRRMLVASPQYLRRRGEPKTPEALVKHDALTHPMGDSADSWRLRHEDREARVRLNVVFRSNALFALRELALHGVGIALLPAWFVREPLRQGALRPVLGAWQTELVTATAIHRTEQRGAPRVRTLIDHLRAACAQLA
jgi:DNA-binding transcriptional LysR family regulator